MVRNEVLYNRIFDKSVKMEGVITPWRSWKDACFDGEDGKARLIKILHM